MKTLKIENCIKCGKNNITTNIRSDFNTDTHGFMIKCLECFNDVVMRFSYDAKINLDYVVEQWNKRNNKEMVRQTKLKEAKELEEKARKIRKEYEIYK